jgi:hypothetical protein
MTNREFIAQVRSTHKLLSGDNVINDRTILREGRLVSLAFIKQQTDKRRLWSSPNLFTPLQCLPMKKVPLTECCEFTSECMIARSVNKMPKIAEGIYGLLIQGVSSMDNKEFFKESSPRRYANTLKLQLPNKDLFYWMYNDYLYVTNPETLAVNMSCFPEGDIDKKLLYSGADCECGPMEDEPCHSPLDEPFRCPGFLQKSVIDLVSKKLLETYHRLSVDAPSDNEEKTK